ncbi:MAG: DUF4147 domain-containing protein [Alphaproteobacteria bacterium]|nr:DUF4147 domain-containing protein [Alphaproteobacteria bacterium]
MTPAADARSLVRPVLEALDPRRAVRERLAGSPRPDRYVLVAFGKAAAAMAHGAVDTWGPPVDGVVLTVDGTALGAPDGTALRIASHPLPDARGVAATREILDLVQRWDLPTLVLVSGGGSALLVAPRPPDTLDSIARGTRERLDGGADIEALNAWRAARSLVKGGGLARACRGPTRTLVVRDLDGPLERVASGPMNSTPLEEVLGPDDAVRAASAVCASLGYTVHTGPFATGEARALGATALDGLPPRTALVRSGEPTVTVRGSGTGGRSQELALSAAIAYRGRPDWALLALGTDGIDGPTDAAGAVVDGTTWAPGAEAALADNDAHPWLDARGALVRTGPTGTNVTDLQVVLTGAKFQP